ncbi:Serine aminopeptidase S33 [Gracilaria domingensis]|nr:Serine aminopeptidase S33 [Gracilaria domingensis]
MGALGACRLLLKEPSRIANVVLIAPAILPGSHLPSWLQLGLRQEGFCSSPLRLARHPSRKLPEEIVEGYRLPLKALSWERGVINFSMATLKERAKALDTAEDFVEMIGQLTYPPQILIVHGESDAVVPLANSRKLAGGFGAKLKIMERCGHVPHEEAPIEFCDIVYDFLHDADVL